MPATVDPLARWRILLKGPGGAGDTPIFYTSAAWKVWRVTSTAGALDGTPANWETVAYNDAAWYTPTELAPTYGGGLLPAVGITPAQAFASDHLQGLEWLARSNTVVLDALPSAATMYVGQDDGIIVYINGVQRYSKAAWTNYTTDTITLDPAWFQIGNNVVAVHMTNLPPTSSAIWTTTNATKGNPTWFVLKIQGPQAPAALTTPYGVAATDVLTKTAHGLVSGDRIQFQSLTGGAGLSTNTDYVVLASGLTSNAFKLAAVSTGVTVNFTTDITAGTYLKVGKPSKTTVTINSVTFLWTQNATTGIISYPHTETIAAGGPYAVEPIVVPYDSVNGTGGSYYKFLEGPGAGKLVAYWTNALSYGSMTVTTTGGYNRGPGGTIATIEYPAAHSAGASLPYNAAGELHMTLLVDDPLIDLIHPKRTHYAVEFLNIDGVTWDEAFAGVIWDFNASDTDVVYNGIDYLGLLKFSWDERFDPEFPETKAPTGSKYIDTTISEIINAELTYHIGKPDSLVSFLRIGTIGTMSETTTIYSTMTNGLDFIVGLINSHKAGTGKMSRISVDKVGAAYLINVTENPGQVRPALALQYVAGGLIEGYQAIPFGTDWASRVNVIGLARDGAKITYLPTDGEVSQATFGAITQGPVSIESSDTNDLTRRARQLALDASKIGRQIGVGVKLGSFRPLQDYTLTDWVTVNINHGAMDTNTWGSDVFGNDAAGAASGVLAQFWSITGITWESYDDGHWVTNLSLWPRGGGVPLPTGTGLQSSWAVIGYNTNSYGGYVHASLPAAPGAGSLLVCALFGTVVLPSPSGEHAWTLRQSGDAYDASQYGGPGARVYTAVYTRIAGAGESADVAAFTGIGSGLGAGIGTYLYEIPGGSVVSSTVSTGTVVAAGTVAVAGTPTLPSSGMLLQFIGSQRTTYAPIDTWTLAAGQELLDSTTGDGGHPGVWIGQDVGARTLGVTASKDANPNLNMWGYVNIGLLLDTDAINTPNVVVPQTPLSAGNGPPSPDNTTSSTYIDLNTGQQYVRNDDTHEWVPVPGTAVNRTYPFPNDGEEGAEGIPGMTGARGAPGIPGIGIPGMDGEDGETGLPGRQGIDGAAGATGSTGAAGVPGIGIPGLDGEDGYDGIPGIPGVAGSAGSPGATGPMGIGFPGPDGEDGEMGIPGVRGADGASGAPGSTGSTGATGLGVPGIDGEDGYDGIPGIPGAAGAAGSAGATGPIGLMGVPGIDGEDAEGIPGVRGATGAAGTPGSAGRDGAFIPGIDGEDGESYFIPGPKGDTGTTGTTGAPGSGGSGSPAPPGSDGEDGDTMFIPPTPISAILPRGIIVMWAGTIATIPSGWFLCNGANGTPDLSDRFIVGEVTTPGGTGGTISPLAALTAHVFTQPSAHSAHVVTQPSGHSAHTLGVSGAGSAHTHTGPSHSHSHTHTGPSHTHTVTISSVTYLPTTFFYPTGYSVGKTAAAGTQGAFTTGSTQGSATAFNTGAAGTGATGSDATAAGTGATGSEAIHTHAAGTIDAHSAHTGGAVDAHSAHSGGAVDAHAIYKYFKMAFIQKA